MICFYFCDALDGKGYFSSLSELLVEFDEVLKPFKVVSELNWLCLEIQHLHIVAGLAISAAV